MKKTNFLLGSIASVVLLSGCNSDINVLLGYSANQLCSRHFISEEPIEFIKQRVIPEALGAVQGELQLDVDSTAKQVSLSTQIDGTTLTRTSVFREGLGCTLLHDLSPAQLHAQTADLDFPAPSPSTPIDKALRPDISLDSFFATNHKGYTWSDNTFAVAVMHKGHLVAQQYDEFHNGGSRMLSWSMAKTLTGLMTGLLVDQGKLTLEQPLRFGEHVMTVKNLMNMSSGVKWAETPDIHGYEDLAPMWYHTGDSVNYVTQLPKDYEPGSKFEYATGTTQLLSSALMDASGGDIQSLNNLYQKHFFAPLGINNAIAEFDEAGNLRGGARVFLSVHDWLKIGQLFINNGRWQGEQVVSEAWLKEVMMSNGVDKHYGGQLWLNDMSFWLPKLPKDTVSLRGHRGQYVVIIPSKQLVVVRLGAYGAVVNQHLGLANKRLFKSVLDVIEQLEK
ncbi:serine hydrolase domain-containing protein [Pseudoalteromonas umbrosa]|uniref:serine hydrolase domain-containing protein n=1 Tax=Pseudoalteromonas umbrosa TaxID=3048489 RepID=UPI0024C41D48|nr:serine hydrolase [Pseudoalteromonas sp. B95]MDK1286905.1 serine hydrolase [Pseudoalteromonas sp. B95]